MPKPPLGGKDLAAAWGVDRDRALHGQWCSFGPIRIRLAHAGPDNPRWLAALHRAAAARGPRGLRGDLSPEEAQSLLAEAYAQAIVLDWQGVDLPFAPDHAAAVLLAYPALFQAIRDQAEGLALWRQEVASLAGE